MTQIDKVLNQKAQWILILTCTASQTAGASHKWLPFRQSHPLLTVLRGQPGWIVDDTGAGFNNYKGTRYKWLNSCY